ncbi:MAG: glycosyltransferase [Evtepia gabavorous]
MKILLTCGGTAGHINPAVALARMFQERMEDSQVLFVGAKGGMEERLVPKEGFPLETVTISSFWRSLSPSSLRHNLRTLRNLSVSKRRPPGFWTAFSRTWWWGRGICLLSRGA